MKIDVNLQFFFINKADQIASLELHVRAILPYKLRDLVEKWMTVREGKFIKKRNLNMKVLSEFAELFNDAPRLSSKFTYS